MSDLHVHSNFKVLQSMLELEIIIINIIMVCHTHISPALIVSGVTKFTSTPEAALLECNQTGRLLCPPSQLVPWAMQLLEVVKDIPLMCKTTRFQCQMQNQRTMSPEGSVIYLRCIATYC